MLKRMDITVVSACAAHLLTWCAGLWLAIGPVYQGVSATPTVPGGVESSATRHTATLVEQNGLWIIWLLILPLLITGLVLLAIRLTDTGKLSPNPPKDTAGRPVGPTAQRSSQDD